VAVARKGFLATGLGLLGTLLALLFAAGCSLGPGPNIEAARKFERFPLYWPGETFEGRSITRIGGLEGSGTAVGLIYGTCTPNGGLEPTCALPIQIQISPLCAHLQFVAQAPIWKHRRIRGAPVGTIDGAPVLFTRRTQIKVYRGEGTDPRLPLRVLEALRSLNHAAPVIGPTDVIPGPLPGVLEGTRPCTD
jgi:hypothetical protein